MPVYDEEQIGELIKSVLAAKSEDEVIRTTQELRAALHEYLQTAREVVRASYLPRASSPIATIK